MKKTLFGLLLTTLLALGSVAEAQTARTPRATTSTTTPTCQIGTVLSVNPNRQVAEGEKEITIPGEGKVVITTQRETVGSSHIVLRRCVLPKEDIAIVVGGTTPWFKVCGQNFLPEGWTVPVPAAAVAAPSVQLPKGPLEIRLSMEKIAADVNVHVDGEVKVVHSGEVRIVPPPPASPDSKPALGKKGFPWKKTLAIVGGGAVAGYATYYYWPCLQGLGRR